ncbi:hypothetical protein ACFC58_25385 [Kitasatospora purpeofusca]
MSLEAFEVIAETAALQDRVRPGLLDPVPLVGPSVEGRDLRDQ